MKSIGIAWMTALASLLGVVALAATTPTPGPAARAGQAIDKVMATVTDEVGDALLVTRVRVALLEHLRGDGLRVRIEARGGVVTLDGMVDRRSSVPLAEEVTRSLDGVSEVHNRIKLASAAEAGKGVAGAVGKAEREVNDAILEARIKAVLLDQLGRVGFKIEGEATDGVVSLTGTVPDDTRRVLAGDVTAKVSGVKELHNLLKLEK